MEYHSYLTRTESLKAKVHYVITEVLTLRIEQQGTEEKLSMMQKVRRKKNIDQE
jgi:regulator of replication initiation timing